MLWTRISTTIANAAGFTSASPGAASVAAGCSAARAATHKAYPIKPSTSSASGMPNSTTNCRIRLCV